MFLFSYGSNNPKQLAERLDHNIEGQAAYVNNWQRAFRGFSRKWNGGVATLIPKRGSRTYGYVTYVSESDLAILDRFEGVASGNYSRKKLVTNEGPAIAYLSNSKDFNKPTSAYLKAVTLTVGSFWDNVKLEDFPIR